MIHHQSRVILYKTLKFHVICFSLPTVLLDTDRLASNPYRISFDEFLLPFQVYCPVSLWRHPSASQSQFSLQFHVFSRRLMVDGPCPQLMKCRSIWSNRLEPKSISLIFGKYKSPVFTWNKWFLYRFKIFSLIIFIWYIEERDVILLFTRRSIWNVFETCCKFGT